MEARSTVGSACNISGLCEVNFRKLHTITRLCCNKASLLSISYFKALILYKTLRFFNLCVSSFFIHVPSLCRFVDNLMKKINNCTILNRHDQKQCMHTNKDPKTKFKARISTSIRAKCL